jgi:regulation of enolase protein 1 (concanavalin A-like superfamily)
MRRSCSASWKVAAVACVAATLLAAGPRVLKGWGLADDPDNDCKFELAGEKLTIRVPGTLHDLVSDDGQTNAPVVLATVRGEFIAMVKVPGEVRPGPEPTVADGAPYNGTGLLIRADKDNYVRLERAGLVRDGNFVTYANFEYFSRGRRAMSEGMRLADMPIHLRLERRGKSVYASTSQDGANWSSFPPVQVDLPEEIKVGVAAVNSSTKPFAAELESFQVFTRLDVGRE